MIDSSAVQAGSLLKTPLNGNIIVQRLENWAKSESVLLPSQIIHLTFIMRRLHTSIFIYTARLKLMHTPYGFFFLFCCFLPYIDNNMIKIYKITEQKNCKMTLNILYIKGSYFEECKIQLLSEFKVVVFLFIYIIYLLA